MNVELIVIIKHFGTDHPVTAAAEKYWQYHPNHTFCPERTGCQSKQHGQLFCNNCPSYFNWHDLPEECPTDRREEFGSFWSVDEEGSVWTPQACGDPVVESELFFAHGSFYEICWNAEDVEAVFRDGQLIYSGHEEVSSIWNIILSTLEYDSPEELAADIEATYRLNCNPLPSLRQRLKHLPLTVQFGFTGGGHYWAAPRSATMVVRLDAENSEVCLQLIDYYADEAHSWWEIRGSEDTPIVPTTEHRTALYLAARDNYLLRRFEETPPWPEK